MTRHEDPATDSFAIAFRATQHLAASTATAAIGLDIEHPPHGIAFTTLETEALPFRSIKAA